MQQPVETKVAAGSFSAAVTGFLTWILVTYVPAFRNGLPPDLGAILPILIGWACGTVASWAAPHTSRPDDTTPLKQVTAELVSDPSARAVLVGDLKGAVSWLREELSKEIQAAARLATPLAAPVSTEQPDGEPAEADKPAA